MRKGIRSIGGLGIAEEVGDARGGPAPRGNWCRYRCRPLGVAASGLDEILKGMLN